MLLPSPRKAALGTVARRLDCSEEQLQAATRAIHPLDRSHGAATRALGKQLQAMSGRFARSLHRASSALELQEMTYVVLSGYAHVARQAEDDYYTPLFEQAAFAVRVEIDAVRLEEIKALL